MRVAQITLRHATEYEKKCRRVDRVALAAEHEIVESPRGADVVHVYGAGVRRPRFWSRVVPVTPLKDAQQTFIPEAIEEQYFAQDAPAGTGVGVYVRRSVKALIEQTQHRLHRTRDDVEIGRAHV